MTRTRTRTSAQSGDGDGIAPPFGVHMGGVHRPHPKLAMCEFPCEAKCFVQFNTSHLVDVRTCAGPRTFWLAGNRADPHDAAVQHRRRDTNNTVAIRSAVLRRLAPRTANQHCSRANRSRQKALPAVTVRSGPLIGRKFWSGLRSWCRPRVFRRGQNTIGSPLRFAGSRQGWISSANTPSLVRGFPTFLAALWQKDVLV